MNARIVCDEKAFLALAPDWERLFSDSELENPFFSWPWVNHWWECLGRPRGYELRILVAYSDALPDQVIGLLPMALKKTAYFGWSFNCLRVAGAELVLDHLDVIAHPLQRDAVAAALIPLLLDHRIHGGDIVELTALANAGALAKALPAALSTAVGVPYRVHCETAPYLPLPVDGDQFQATLGKKLRSNLKRGRNRLTARAGATLSLREIRSIQELPQALSDLEAVHQRRQQQKGNAGVFADPCIRDFHGRAATALLQAGWLRFYLLQAGNHVIAAMYCFRLRRTMSYYMGGFAHEWSDGSPGAVLTADVLMAAVQEGCERFDFLRGDEPYKALWTAEKVTDLSYLLAPNAKGRAWLLGCRLRHWAGRMRWRVLAAHQSRFARAYARNVPTRN